MRPHHIIEEMAAVRQWLGKEFDNVIDREAWAGSEALLPHAVTFDFGDLAPSEEHVEFGLDLLDRGAFQLPFSNCFFTWRANGRAQGIIVADNAVAKDQAHWVIATIGTAAAEGQQREEGFRIPFAMFLLNKTDPMNSPAPILQIMTGGRIRNKDGAELTSEMTRATAGRSMRFVCGAISMLMSRDVSTVIEPAPAKLNAHRFRKGKPAIRDVHIIKVHAEAERHYREAAEIFGTHASPRMHWRRGHFRTIYRGQENQRVIPVAPSLVGSNGNAPPAPKEYLVT